MLKELIIHAAAGTNSGDDQSMILLKEKDRLEKEVARAEGKLANEKFVAKAPAALIEEERTKLANYKDMLAKTTERLQTVLAKLG